MTASGTMTQQTFNPPVPAPTLPMLRLSLLLASLPALSQGTNMTASGAMTQQTFNPLLPDGAYALDFIATSPLILFTLPCRP